MAEQGLMRWLKTGYPLFKEYSGLPSWLLPERSFKTVVDGLGDDKIIELSHCLDLYPPAAIKPPDIESFSSGKLREVCFEWPHLSVVRTIIISLLDSVERIIAKHRCGKLAIEPQVVYRTLMVMSFALFVPQGRKILEALAAIMDIDSESPADLIKKYTYTVLSDNLVITARVNECIDRHYEWARWANLIQQQSQSFNRDYRLIAVTPLLSEELVDVLADMIKESPTYGA